LGLPAGAAQVPAANVSGTVNVQIQRMPNYKAKSSMDGMFKVVNLNKGRSMAMAEDI
jgi:hypothetical protein